MNTYQRKYIRNWFIAIFTIVFIAINAWALITGIVAVKIIWAGVLVLLGGWCVVACIYGFLAEQIYNFRLRGVCENDDELNFLKLYDWAFHQGSADENKFDTESDRRLVRKFLSVKRPKWY